MIKREVLSNGVRIVTETVPYVQSVSVGIWVIAGSRDESAENMGVSHFIEHMMFKGTDRRSAKQIADEFDSIGGQVNAFTEKEYTCYYGKVLSEHLPIALDVLSDMFLNSKFDPKEIELEKNVVLEEIKRHEDSPEDLIHDLFVQKIWDNHLLGNPIIGTNETVSGLKQSGIKDYMAMKYRPDSIVVSVAGNLSHEDIVERVSVLFSGLQGNKTVVPVNPPEFSFKSENISKDTEQVHFCIGSPGFSQLNNERFPLAIMDAALGGGMSSRLFQEIREKRGLAYAIGSYTACYREGGYFAVYGGTSMSNMDEILDITRKELANILRDNITAEEIVRSKNQIRGGMVLSQENMSSRMIRIAKSEIYHNRVIPLDELIASVLAVEHDDIDRVAQAMWGDKALPIVAIGPFNGESDAQCVKQ